MPPPLIMVIDDNVDVTQMLSLLLRSRGYAVETALSGEEALAAMATHRPDLILCDIMMPGLTGLDVFQRVRADARWRALPFVFLTALSDSQTRVTSTELGVEAYITKPFNTQELLSVIAGLLRRARERQTYTASEMDSFKSQLLFMITHELNTPLAVIRMLTDSMQTGFGKMTRAQIASYLDLLARSTNELSAIVDSMLLALQIDSGRAQELYERWAAPLLLQTILKSALAQVQARAQERSVVLQAYGTEQALWVKGHEQQLLQVFTRILDNAIRFSPKGGRVTITTDQVGDRARISVADEGPGMSASEVAGVFDRLHQINRAEQEQQGVGLSLNLARSLVTIHSGEITVDSRSGQGSTFAVWLPLIRPPG